MGHNMVRKATDPQSMSDAFIVAMKSLQRSAQTEKSLRDKLAARQFNDQVIQTIIKKLQDMGLINDQKYAENFVAYQNRISPRGSRYLKLKLMQKGVNKAIAEEVAGSISTVDELALAKEAVAKRLPQLARFDPSQRKLKLARFLTGRGFSGGIIYKVIGDIITEHDEMVD